MIKKIIAIILTLLLLVCLCGCGSDTTDEEEFIITETNGNLVITYVMDKYEYIVLSKNIYNTETGITTEYVYYYTERGWGPQLIDSRITTIDKDGTIISTEKK